ncbi:MAG TPA: undecaprenyl-diphosphatase UppP [Pyrinomonadaceae bacterium]
MTIFQAIVLGIVQGLTEFIPVSSTAHLVFAARAVGLYAGVEKQLQAQQTTASMAVIQLGTLLAVLVYFARDIMNITRAFVVDHIALFRGERRPDGKKLSNDAWLGWLVFLGSLPVGLVGLLFKKQIEGTFTKNLWVIATMMVVVAILLAIAEKVGKRNRGMTDLTIADALAVGGAQVLSLIPGSSRSGSTIMGGLFVGETRETAARFSFLLSIPAIAASGLLELREAIEKLPADSYLSLVIATVVAGIVGYASIWFLLRFLRTHSTGVFIVYRMIVGALILLALAGGYLSASV